MSSRHCSFVSQTTMGRSSIRSDYAIRAHRSLPASRVRYWTRSRSGRGKGGDSYLQGWPGQEVG